MRDFLRRNEQPLVAFLMFLVWSSAYFLSGHLVAGTQTHSLAVPLDSEIPFLPPFVWIYLTIYMTFILPFLLIRDTRFFRLCVASYLSVILVSVAWFMLYPVRYERPPVEIDSLSTWALALTYSFDQPVNCFPSMHASMAMMAALMILEMSVPLGILALVHTVLIGASALFIKQHFVLDIVAGFSLAVLMYYLFFRQKVIEVLSKNFGQLESSLTAVINERIDARVRRIVAEVLDETVERKLREWERERERDGRE